MESFSKCACVVLGLVLPVLRSVAACAPQLAAAAVGAAAAGRTGPAAAGMRSGSRRGDAASEEEGLWLRKRAATAPIAPERLEIRDNFSIRFI